MRQLVLIICVTNLLNEPLIEVNMHILYECEYCGELESDKKYVENHEKECVKNPIHSADCRNCENGDISADQGELTNIKCTKKHWTFNRDASKCPDWEREN